MSLILKMTERIRIKMERMWDTDIVSEAADFCHEAHKGQYRKGTIIPFEEHPLRVGSVVSYHQGTQNQVIAGYLHDVVEDTDKTIEDVAEKFGDEVAHIVAALSEDKSLPTWKERKLDYIQKISAPETVRCRQLSQNLSEATAFKTFSATTAIQAICADNFEHFFRRNIFFCPTKFT